MATLPDPESLLEEQLRFYRAGAAAYEDWETEVFARGGGGGLGEVVRAERRRLLAELRRFGARGHVLELAAGTGTYTGALLETAATVTLVDGSPESLALARSKLGRQSARLRFIEADLFTWRPDRRYDGAVFAFWLSHVPPGRFDAFWELVRDALCPGGRVFFIDSAGAGDAPDSSQTPSCAPPDSSYREWDHPGSHVSVRELDGRRYHVVKVIRQPAELGERLASLGWDASVHGSARSIWGSAVVRARQVTWGVDG
jgi:demethylmenaquinone methyltransferase/2-methoxy-6-polyprenyl-1,4-benzoquinol methylase